MTSPAPAHIPLISPEALKAALGAPDEVALLDVREEGVYVQGHLLLAVSAPLSRLEVIVDALVPRRATPLVLIDGGNEDAALKAAGTLSRFGYGDVSVLEGGTRAWQAAGFELFEGLGVLSKALSEQLDLAHGTPHITAAELHELQQAGSDLVVLDCRPFNEYSAMSIPGAINCPGADLIQRIPDIAPSAQTLVVVNCAGRTRSIFGAQSLIDAGLANPVVALENGTMGWTLAGLSLEHGATHVAPAANGSAPSPLTRTTVAFAKGLGVREIGEDEIARLRRDGRTVYVFDIRTSEEYRAGHVPGSRSAPGGQLANAPDRYVGTRNAVLVLADDGDGRAYGTAAWLRQLGWNDVYVLEHRADAVLETGPERPLVLGLAAARAPWIGPHALSREIADRTASVIDIGDSRTFRKRHIPGAVFTTRAKLAEALPLLPEGTRLVLTSRDGVLARLAASDLTALGHPARALLGGTDAWLAAGLPSESGADKLLVDDDVWYPPYQRPAASPGDARAYLDRGTGLLEKIARDGDARLRPAARATRAPDTRTES